MDSTESRACIQKALIVVPTLSEVQDDDDFTMHRKLLYIQYQLCMAGLPFEQITWKALGGLEISRSYGFSLIVVVDGQEDIVDRGVDIECVLRLAARNQAGLIVLEQGTTRGPLCSSMARLRRRLGYEVGETVAIGVGRLQNGNGSEKVLGEAFRWPPDTIDRITLSRIDSDHAELTVLAALDDGLNSVHAIVAGTDPIRHVIALDDAILSKGNWLWRAMRWASGRGQEQPVLSLSRSRGVLSARIDVDLSKYHHEIEVGIRPLVDRLERWKQVYGFVGSAFINIGDDFEAGEYTDWVESGSLYRRLRDLGNEIGSHSYTHPFDVSALSESEIEFEFAESRRAIERNLGIEVSGAAIPGNPESFAAALQVGRYYDYVSGRFSGHGDGFAGAIGRLASDASFLYFCPNVWPDFTAIRFFGWTTEQTCLESRRQVSALFENARCPIIQPLWHDYGIAGIVGRADDFAPAIYEGILDFAAERNCEILPLGVVASRIVTLEKAELTVEREGSEVEVFVRSSGDGLGGMCLEMPERDTIASVDGWCAYSDRQLFLPRAGGKFRIILGKPRNDAARIVDLSNGCELIHLEKTLDGFVFRVEGEGTIVLADGGEKLAIDGTIRAPAGVAGKTIRVDDSIRVRLPWRAIYDIRVRCVGSGNQGVPGRETFEELTIGRETENES